MGTQEIEDAQDFKVDLSWLANHNSMTKLHIYSYSNWIIEIVCIATYIRSGHMSLYH